MKGLPTTLLIMICMGWTATALAVPAHRSLSYPDGANGPVTFQGKTHRQSCSACHQAGVFPVMRQGAETITMKKIDAGKQCGACHNGSTAFASPGNCRRCHRPPETPKK